MTSRHAWVFLLIGALLCGGWINYDDKVERSEPQYGKEFIGFYLKVFTDNVEFEQETPEPITVVLKNTNPRSTLMPDGGNAAERRYALYIVVADKDGATSLFSRNLLEKDGGIVTAGKVPPQAETELLKVPFDSLEVAKVEAFEDGLPKFEPDQRMAHGSHGAIRRYQIDGAIEGSRTHGAQYAVLLLKSIHRNDHPAPANTKAAKITRISLDDPVRSQRKLVRFPNGFTPRGQPMLVMLSVAT